MNVKMCVLVISSEHVFRILEFSTTCGCVRKLSRLNLNAFGETHMFIMLCQVDVRSSTKARESFPLLIILRSFATFCEHRNKQMKNSLKHLSYQYCINEDERNDMA